MGKKGKARACRYEIIPGGSGVLSEPYQFLEEVRRKFHPELKDARIGLAWRDKYRQDKDGHVILGKCVKVGALQKEFGEFDFIIVLNKQVWGAPEFTDEKRRALVDHELCHAAVAEDRDGYPLSDARGRPVWRCRKHDIEEFHAIVQRHGFWKGDLEHFAHELMERQAAPLLASHGKCPPKPAVLMARAQ